MENGQISKDQLTVSSAWNNDFNTFGAHRARLNLARWPQGWTASVEDRSPWLQIDFRVPFIVTRVATQGYGGTLDQWVEKYRMSWRNEAGNWRNYTAPHRVSSYSVQWKTKVMLCFAPILLVYTLVYCAACLLRSIVYSRNTPV